MSPAVCSITVFLTSTQFWSIGHQVPHQLRVSLPLPLRHHFANSGYVVFSDTTHTSYCIDRLITMISFTGNTVISRNIFLVVIGLLLINVASSLHAVFSGRLSIKFDTLSIASRSIPNSQLYQSFESYDLNTNVHAVSRRSAMIISPIVFFVAASQPQRTNADVSDGNALPKGAQEFARTLKLKTDIKVRDLS
jgi:hypothetical protein